jgi:hypothetical protein
MKSFSFLAGNAQDATRGMSIVVDRTALPAQMALGMWLDDDGKALPGYKRPAAKTVAAPQGEIVFLDTARLSVTLGGIQGTVKVAAGTHIEIGPRAPQDAVQAVGADIALRGTRRFAQITAPTAQIGIDRQPNAVRVLTIDAEKPAGAQPGDRFRVRVSQLTTDGKLVGGVTVVFTFDN